MSSKGYDFSIWYPHPGNDFNKRWAFTRWQNVNTATQWMSHRRASCSRYVRQQLGKLGWWWLLYSLMSGTTWQLVPTDCRLPYIISPRCDYRWSKTRSWI